MRYTDATKIIEQLDMHDRSAPAAPFAWRKAWLVRRSLLNGALFNPSSPLHKTPGLRYTRLAGIVLGDKKDKPVDLRTSAEAVQVGVYGTRLRSFNVKEKTTLKIVDESSHYGPATKREIALRSDRLPGLLVPHMDGHESRNGYLFVREQLIEGRLFNVRRDRPIFSAQVITPLSGFYEAYGIKMKPLAEALGPLAPFIRNEKDGDKKLGELLEDNPQVATSLCHNDVLSSNLVIGRKGVYFIDWGLATQSLCGLDFVRTGVRYKDDTAIQEHIRQHLFQLHKGRLGLDHIYLIQEAWLRFLKASGSMRTEIGTYSPAAPATLQKTGT